MSRKAWRKIYGFFGNQAVPELPPELDTRFGPETAELKTEFVTLFAHLPVALFFGIKKSDGSFSFGMFNHAGLTTHKKSDPQAPLLIQKILKSVIGKPGLQNTQTNVTEESGLMWGDYIPGTEAVYRPSARGMPDLFDVTLEQAHQIIDHELNSAGYSIDFIARGHQHMLGLLKGAIYT